MNQTIFTIHALWPCPERYSGVKARTHPWVLDHDYVKHYTNPSCQRKGMAHINLDCAGTDKWIFKLFAWAWFSPVLNKVTHNNTTSPTNESTCPGHWVVGFVSPYCKYMAFWSRIMYDAPLDHGQYLCEVQCIAKIQTDRENLIYCPDKNFCNVCTWTLIFEIWPFDRVMTQAWIMHNNYCKHGYFCWGKISRKCWQDISHGDNFHDINPI